QPDELRCCEQRIHNFQQFRKSEFRCIQPQRVLLEPRGESARQCARLLYLRLRLICQTAAAAWRSFDVLIATWDGEAKQLRRSFFLPFPFKPFWRKQSLRFEQECPPLTLSPSPPR